MQSGKDGTFPSGPGQATVYEFLATVEWDGAQFTGVLYDLTRDPMVVTSGQQFTISGNRVTLYLGASALGDPSTSTWNDATCTRHYDKLGRTAFSASTVRLISPI